VNEFKGFAFKGNLVDLAMGVVIGAAFGKLLDSFVKNIIMPAVSLVMPGQQGYLDWKLTLGSKEVPYGLFIGDVVSFLLITLVLFIFMVKLVGWIMRNKQEEAVAPAPLTKDQELLSEIRDLLSRERGNS
jgi:large conductance mechanosensitive channel